MTEAACRTEIEEVHRFFQEWFAGRLPREAFDRVDVLAEDFRIVWPDGSLTTRVELLERLQSAYGSRAEAPLTIEIDRIELREVGPALWLATYEEWHGSETERQGRLSSAVLRLKAEGTPHGVEWLHVHETWLPSTELSGL
jgi:hypothetical protein